MPTCSQPPPSAASNCLRSLAIRASWHVRLAQDAVNGEKTELRGAPPRAAALARYHRTVGLRRQTRCANV